MERAAIKGVVSKNFIHALEELGQEGLIKTFNHFASEHQLDRSTISRIKRGEGSYVTVDLIYHAVNDLGLNANHIFAKDGLKKEELLRNNINSPTVNGDNNTIIGQHGKLNVNNNTGSIGDITIAEKIIQEIPNKKHQAALRKQMTGFSQQIEDLKKMVLGYEKQLHQKEKEIAYDKKHIETQEKLIKMYETGKTKKKWFFHR